MQTIKIEKVIGDYVFNNKDTSITVVTKILEYCKDMETKILDKPDDIALNYFYELMFIVEFLYKSVGLVSVISQNPNSKKMDEIVKAYLHNLFINKQIKDKLIKINKKIKDKCIEKIIEKFSYNQIESLKKIKNDIDTLTNKIHATLEENPILITTDEMKKHIDNMPSTIALDRNLYYFLQRKMRNADLRKRIEETYFKKTEKCITDFAKLLLYRHKFAEENGYSTYFDYLKNKHPGESERAKNLINDLIVKIEERSRKEMDRIHRELLKDGYSKKVDLYDVIYYYEKLKTNYLFTPARVLKVLLESVKKLFGISFIKISSNISLWDKHVETYNVVNSYGVILGVAYFDLEKRNNKLLTSPLCIHLCYKHTNILGDKTVPKVVLVSGYMGMNKNCMTYSDVVSLFREMGILIQTIAHSTREIYQKSDEYAILMSQILEYIAWEKDTIQNICEGLDDTVYDHILFTRYINFANAIKMRCINSLFDHIIHNSIDFIETLRLCFKENTSVSEVIQSLYKKIYSEIMSSQNDIVNLDIIGINPLVIYQEINGNEGTLYGSVLIEVLSFSIYSLVKMGKGKDFVNKILCTDVNKLKKLLYEFIMDLNEDSYDLYLHEVIGYNEIDTEVNLNEKEKNNNVITETSGNYFKETDTESDEENIIYVTDEK